MVQNHLKDVGSRLLIMATRIMVALLILMTLPRNGVQQKSTQMERMSLAKVNGDTAAPLAHLIQIVSYLLLFLSKLKDYDTFSFILEMTKSCSDIWKKSRCNFQVRRNRCNRTKAMDNCRETCGLCNKTGLCP